MDDAVTRFDDIRIENLGFDFTNTFEMAAQNLTQLMNDTMGDNFDFQVIAQEMFNMTNINNFTNII